MKKMLLLNGSFNEIQLIHTAHRMGYYVITAGNDPSGEGHKYANQYIPCDYSDKEAVLKIAKDEKVDVICACSNDFGALSADYASEKLGLPGHDSYETSRLFHEKDCFKKMAKELGLSTPEAFLFDNITDALDYIDTLTAFPKLIKPADLSGGKGIQLVYDKKSASEAVKQAFERSKVKRILIEDYIEGQQQGITVFVYKGKVVLEFATNDYAYDNPYMVWMACPPADHYDEIRSRIVADIEKIAKEKSIKDGFFTFQYILKDGKPYYLETMRRCLGNQHYMCMSKDTGVDFYELYIRTQSGEDCAELLKNRRPTDTFSGFLAIFAPKNGVIKSIEINPMLQSRLFDIKMFGGPGYTVTDYLNDKIGALYFTMHKDEIDDFLKDKRNMFRVEMQE